MGTRRSGFKTASGQVEYDRLYDTAVAMSPAPVEESEVPTSFGNTHILTSGDPTNPPLIALHATSISSTMWLPLLPTLTRRHRVHMLDAIGDVNKSDATAALSSPARVVEWIDKVLDSLAIERSDFVGASIGAWMATHYAIARPHRVDRLAMLGPGGIVSPAHLQWVFPLLGFLLRPDLAKADSLLGRITMNATRPTLEVEPWHSIAQQFMFGMVNSRASMRRPLPVRCNIEPLAVSRIPVLAAIGRQETLHDGPTMARRFREQLPEAQVELVDSANHLIFIDQTAVVTELLSRFLGTDGPERG